MQARPIAIAFLLAITAGCASEATLPGWPAAPGAGYIPATLALDQQVAPLAGRVEIGTAPWPPSGRICHTESRLDVGQPPAAARVTTHCANLTFGSTPDGWQRASFAIVKGPATGSTIMIDRAPDGSILIPETLPAGADRTQAGRSAHAFRAEMAALLRASRQFQLEQGRIVQTGSIDGCSGRQQPRCSDLFPSTSLNFIIPRRTSCRTLGSARAGGRDVIVLVCAIAWPLGLDDGLSWIALDRATGLRLREAGYWGHGVTNTMRETAMRLD